MVYDLYHPPFGLGVGREVQGAGHGDSPLVVPYHGDFGVHGGYADLKVSPAHLQRRRVTDFHTGVYPKAELPDEPVLFAVEDLGDGLLGYRPGAGGDVAGPYLSADVGYEVVHGITAERPEVDHRTLLQLSDMLGKDSPRLADERHGLREIAVVGIGLRLPGLRLLAAVKA